MMARLLGFAGVGMLGVLLCACQTGRKPMAGSQYDPEENPLTAVDPAWKGAAKPGSMHSMLGGFSVHTPRSEGIDTHPEVYGEGERAFLYFASDREGRGYNVYRKGVNSRALQMLTSQSGDELWPRVSPDGHYLAFGANKLGNWDIYLMDLTDLSRPPALITPGSGSDDIHPTWASDGSRVVYASWSDTSGSYVLKQVVFGPRTDMRGEMAMYQPASCDVTGDELIFAELPGSAGGEIPEDMGMSMEGYPSVMSRGPLFTNQHELISGLHPDFQPTSGSMVLVYQDSRKAGERRFGLRTLDVSTGVVSIVPTGDDHGAIQPRWSPDGRYIVYTTVAKDAAMKMNGDKAPSGGDGFGIASPDGRVVSDLRNPTYMGTVSDPVWVNYMGEERLFFSANDARHESIMSIKLAMGR